MNKKEFKFHISKRKFIPKMEVIAIRTTAIILALLVSALVTMGLTGDNPIEVFKSLVLGSFGTTRKGWILFQNIAILLCVSLALAPAYRMRFWNVGGEGQILMGCLASAACMIKLGDALPNALLIPVMLFSSICAGALWAFIPGFFKAKWGTNETLFTLMMNYVATQIVAYYVIHWEVPKGSGKIGIINQATEAGWLPQIGSKYLLNILIVAVVTIIMYVYLNYSKQGYEISVVGESERTARYVGINVENVIIRTLIISGALCGLAGFLLVAGTDHTVTTTIANGRGFTGVMVAWLGKFNPVKMIFTSFLLVFMDRGASEISTKFGLNHAFGDILTGIIIFFIIGSEFFIRYKISFSDVSALPSHVNKKTEVNNSDDNASAIEEKASQEEMNPNDAEDKTSDAAGSSEEAEIKDSREDRADV
ncbi:ABC transporter permease [Oribacterium sp. C9]|uniref:ABC transporter permease n=1 Tax=Oribacterium sp. C9 TaxID=1943579 RepID=UPI00098FDF91|nr:ABC transporter permease [Oribacterium sp. C9]OON85957.1 ABC transporter permease [Oribacterium sp. C9]